MALGSNSSVPCMSFMTRLKRFGFDYYLLLLIGTVLLASFVPARGAAGMVVDQIAYFAVSLLFFLYGAKLDASAILAGISNLRLQGLILLSTFVVFPVLGLLAVFVLAPFLPEPMRIGILFLTLLPSTVQSSIAFTSIARGNVPAAVCAASVSNMAGVLITPALAALFLHTSGMGVNGLDAIIKIGMQLILPFAVGQLARPLIGKWLGKHGTLTRVVDRGSILIIVYSAFSEGVLAGIWSQVDIGTLALLFVSDAVLLAIIMGFTSLAGRLLKLPYQDEMALFFCGSKKSLASGLPMANILFAGQAVSMIVLPLMLFHQIQLFVCAIIAQRASQRLDDVVKSA